ncbi:DNA methylase [Candidatus Parcubacteria bacterium]|nr:DNA methylase [Candidatus Parcubacteria bacterium]
MDFQAGRVYAKNLGINLDLGGEKELFKWFLACLLFGKPIQQEVAKKTFFEFEKNNLTSPKRIINCVWDKLVKVLDDGHYVRYDYSTADKLLRVCGQLLDKYGTMRNLIKASDSIEDLKKRMLEFKGIGPVTAKIFIRDIKKVFLKIKLSEKNN